MTTTQHPTGRTYDSPQVLEITAVKGGWVFDDPSRHMFRMFVRDHSEGRYATDPIYSDWSLGKYILNRYDRGDYTELSVDELISLAREAINDKS